MAVGREMEALKVRPSRTDQKAERERILKMAADFPALIKKVPTPVARELLSHWVEGITLDKKGRVGALKLRSVPASSYDSGSQVHPGRGRRCWRAGCRPSSPR